MSPGVAWVLLVGIPGLALQSQTLAASPPVNDNFAAATHLQGSPNHVTATIAGPTIEPDEPLQSTGIKGTIWWAWTAPSEGRAIITADWVWVGTNYLISKIEVYSGASLAQLTRVGYRSFYPDGPIIFHAEAGATYYIQAWARENNDNEPTDFRIELFPFAPLINDKFAEALNFESSDTPTPRSVIGATTELGEPIQSAIRPIKTVWWKYQAVTNLRAVIEPGFGTIANFTTAVYLGDTVENLHLVTNGIGSVQFDAWALETYHIAVEVPLQEDGDVALRLWGGGRIAFGHDFDGNLVANHSFEASTTEGFAQWSGHFGGGGINSAGPDGANYALVTTNSVWQDIPTIPGQSYRVQFVYFSGQQELDSGFNVNFGGDPITFTIPSTNYSWRAADVVFHPTNTVTRLEFKSSLYAIGLDQVVVRRLNTTGPQFVSSERDADGLIWYSLKARTAVFRCVIDQQIDGGPWQPFRILSTSQGLIGFGDDIVPDTKVHLYRARLLQ